MAGNPYVDTLGGFTLTTDGFPDFYSRIQAMRFPISVAEVLELRDLINHSADVYEENTESPQNREFRDSLENAIQSFGIDNRHHSERLVRVLTMMRVMHFQHTLASRNAEQQLRQEQSQNRRTHGFNRRNGLLAILVALGAGLFWALSAEAGWGVKLLSLAAAIGALGYFHTLPQLDRELEQITRQLNDVLRKRVDSLNWRTLIHKLSLLLGFKKIQGIEVFRHEPAETDFRGQRLH